MSIYILFPGQGAQVPGMGHDFHTTYESYRNLVKEASDVSGIDLESVLADKDLLDRTENSQIAIFTMSTGIHRILLENGIRADALGGLSLGEYGALCAAGVFSFSDGVKLLKKRSEAMQKATEKTSGFLAAVSFFSRDLIEDALKGKEAIYISNYNAPTQTVVGGHTDMKEDMESALKAAGAKKITFLNVSGAFHTPLMEEAGTEFREYLDTFRLQDPKVRVLSNYKGDFYEVSDDYQDILEKHISSSVRFSDSLEKLPQSDEDVYIQVGPGKALASLLKQNKVKGTIYPVDSVTDLETLIKDLKKEKMNG